MSKKATFSYLVDGDFDSINYYLSELPMDIEAMPVPKMTGITELEYTDLNLELNKTYYARFASVRGATLAMSSEVQFDTNAALFDPLLLASIKVLLDDESIVTTVTSNSEVLSWSDRKSGYLFNKDALYASGPLLVNANLNGRKILRFSDSLLFCNSSALMSEWRNKSSIWAFIVYKDIVNSLSDKTVFGISTSDESAGFSAQSGGSLTSARNRPYFFTRKSGGDVYAELNTTVAKNNIWTMSYYEAGFSDKRLRIASDGSPLVIKSNAFDTTSNTENSNSSGFAIGAVNKYLSQVFKGDVACVVFGSGGYPSQGDIDKIFGWAAHKYGLTANLPASHPYKNLLPIA
ncbi:MAG: hypothetical protein JNL15_00995 [Acinetobacter johnsonii]|nr:hypothetical protein [Acinetobacter johnsonii]